MTSIRWSQCQAGTGCRQHVDMQLQCRHRCAVQTVRVCVIGEGSVAWQVQAARTHRQLPACAQTTCSFDTL